MQKVLCGRVFYPDIIRNHGMSTLADIVEIQSWTHLFMTTSPTLYDEQVKEFYYNMEFTKDKSLNTLVGNWIFHLNEEILGKS